MLLDRVRYDGPLSSSTMPTARVAALKHSLFVVLFAGLGALVAVAYASASDSVGLRASGTLGSWRATLYTSCSGSPHFALSSLPATPHS
jgi:hypothetical protein